MSEHQYSIRYRIEAGKFKDSDAEGNEGLTDSLVLISIIYPGDGSSSTLILSADGRNITGKDLGPLPVIDSFKAWSMMANSLMSNHELPKRLREICETAFSAVQEIVLDSR